MTESFAQYNFQPFIQTALKKIGFKQPTPVQQRLIPLISKGKNVVGQAETGSGKTHAFLLPIVNTIDPKVQGVQAVITTPSRELAYQIYEAAKQLLESQAKLIVHNYVGGTDKKRQIEKLGHLQPQLVIGTPGRVHDLIKEHALDLHRVHYFVVDEADMTLDMGFLKDVDAIASVMPEQLQIMVFSATIPPKLQPFLRKYLSTPEIVKISNKTVISPTIKNWLLSTKGKSRNELIYKLLTMGEPYLALVFANTKTRVDELTDFLRSQGLRVAKLHGDLTPRERKQTMRAIQNLDYQFVVATDLAARGIDIKGISLVINDEIPRELEFFVHRVGRTGRNGLDGTAITLYSPADDAQITELEKLGIAFQPKVFRDGELVDTYQRDRRIHRHKQQESLDPKLRGLVKKEQKKRKPGYRKKIRRAISQEEQRKRKLERRNRH
ncbi:DEAD/DEAH box helicase [Liquorilactobacillus nagelii]|uniref:DEAD/DEAH box helicase n=1 Tax=Liquorilactobacillus nagelii TaxID=82688 RepID=UPI0006F08FC9|nr:DEAD/DEAH box helicase [Liquorilactobacillus nagelii]KRL40518.1 ATP-dependent RNA helicase DeaD [Liquorilactobacillus nagelii DSM 13675]QYH54449.1 DEAD/DEAH box helicase [Liquorilactobacillus nagelii DSM 13675]